jgi:uncharacterized protein YceH (UPF0502 family)
MEFILTPEETRVLGCLIEKQITTPEYYPLTLNALLSACNQKSSRDPVVAYDEKSVVRALDGLREKKLARMVSAAESRVAKYRQVFTDTANLTEQELGLLCVLMLRGPQTVGELRTRTERLCTFNRLEEVEASLLRLMNRQSGAMVARLPRQSGFKESRYAHLLSGAVTEETTVASLGGASLKGSEADRIAKLEAEIEVLHNEVRALQKQFSEFKNQFE